MTSDSSIKKAELIKGLECFVNSPITAAGSFGGIDLCSTYLNMRDRDYVITVLTERFPHATASLEDPSDWADKMQSLCTRKQYVNVFVGHVAEQQAMDTLSSMGIHAEQFESLTHADNDLIDDNGVEYSVKSYKHLSDFIRVVDEHPASDHYVINKELFAEIDNSGRLDLFKDRGIHIIDGQFSHSEAVDLAQERLDAMDGSIVDEIHDGVLDDVPFVAGIVTLCNIGVNVYRLKQGSCSKHEAVKNVLAGLGRIGASGGAAAAGGAAGAAIGSVVFPLAGTLIGGGVGAFLGSALIRNAVRDMTAYWKWGSSTKAYDYFASKYGSGWSEDMENRTVHKYLHLESIKEQLSFEERRLKKYEKALSLDSAELPTLPAVLVNETVHRLRHSVARCDSARSMLFEKVRELCITWGLDAFPRERDRSRMSARRMYGALIAENHSWLVSPTEEESLILEKMSQELLHAPNNPYRLKYSKDDVVGALVVSLAADT